MLRTIQPGGPLTGALVLPGDKSISHRYAILASIAEGVSTIRNYSTGADCHSTLGAAKALGIDVEVEGTTVTIHGKGLDGWRVPAGDIDAGNSGSLIRMMAGPLAAQPFTSRIIGDESLTGRPMGRIIDPLTEMGAAIEARDGKYPPLVIRGAKLKPLDYTLPVASAQVKTCVLFAGLYADGATIVREPVRSRDHTELALREFGADISVVKRVITVQGRPVLNGRELMVPSDISSAAFFLVAALIVPGSDLTIRGVGLNPTRSMLLDFLIGAGAKISVSSLEQVNGEMIGDIRVQYSEMRGGKIVHYHGWADPGVSPKMSIDYYEAAVKTMKPYRYISLRPRASDHRPTGTSRAIKASRYPSETHSTWASVAWNSVRRAG